MNLPFPSNSGWLTWPFRCISVEELVSVWMFDESQKTQLSLCTEQYASWYISSCHILDMTRLITLYVSSGISWSHWILNIGYRYLLYIDPLSNLHHDIQNPLYHHCIHSIQLTLHICYIYHFILHHVLVVYSNYRPRILQTILVAHDSIGFSWSHWKCNTNYRHHKYIWSFWIICIMLCIFS